MSKIMKQQQSDAEQASADGAAPANSAAAVAELDASAQDQPVAPAEDHSTAEAEDLSVDEILSQSSAIAAAMTPEAPSELTESAQASDESESLDWSEAINDGKTEREARDEAAQAVEAQDALQSVAAQEPAEPEDLEDTSPPAVPTPQHEPTTSFVTEPPPRPKACAQAKPARPIAKAEPDRPGKGFAAPAPPRMDQIPPVVSDETIQWDASKVDRAVVAFHERYSAICEQYRSVSARLLNMSTDPTHQLIVITSSIPQEGKSVSTVNLGMVMAEGGQHTVLIADADFRRASIAKMLGIESSPGLADLIRGDVTLAEALHPSHVPNLKILTAGAMHDKAYGELLGSSRTQDTLAELREQFDFVLLDSPPVNTVSDVSMLAPYCDGAIMVIEMNRTPEPTVQEAVRTLQTTNVSILGCILSRHGRRGGYYYNDHYSGYYYKDD